MDYDMSFRADEQADRDPEDSLEPSGHDFIKKLIIDVLEEFTDNEHYMNGELAEEIIKALKPYVDYSGKE